MTRQVSDKLIYDGEQCPLLCSIHLPQNDARVIELTDEEYKSLFDDGDDERKINLKKVKDEILENFKSNEKTTGQTNYVLNDEEIERLEKYTYRSPAERALTTACWRRFISTWEIKEDVLYLSGIIGRYKLLSDEAIIADWYTGTVKVGVGKVLDSNMIMASGDIYENENHITIENGMIINTAVIERDEQYESLYGDNTKRSKDQNKNLIDFLNEDD